MSEILMNIHIHLKKAIQANMVTEVVHSAMFYVRNDSLIAFDEAVRLALIEWDIISDNLNGNEPDGPDPSDQARDYEDAKDVPGGWNGVPTEYDS